MNLLWLNCLRIVFAGFLMISGAIPLSLSLPIEVQAQSRNENFLERVLRRLTTRPKRTQRPATNRGGGNREDLCRYTKEDLVALVPAAPEKGYSYLEQTIKEHPTFFFYVPYSPRLGLEAKFVLKDADEETVYKTKFLLVNTPGLIDVPIPATQSGLETSQQYRWAFSVICNPSNPSGNATVNGWIERVNFRDLSTIDPTNLSEQELLRLYADHLIWFDMLNILRKQIQSNPQDTEFRTYWETLLENMGLRDTVSGSHP
ncbi:MAG: DUF928 domain-containing protein [Symploca sp. SIO2B6]|nr:DUF928 domain-containing protein [Symploca sp. SIO2B6]